MESLLRVARAGMEQLFKRVSSLGYVLLLTDAEGIAVDYIGNDQWDRELRRAGLYLGADWNEQHVEMVVPMTRQGGALVDTGAAAAGSSVPGSPVGRGWHDRPTEIRIPL